MADRLIFDLRVVRGAAFSLEVAESLPLDGVTGIVGPSGGGKTTLLRALAGLERATRADVRFRGEVWDGPGQHMPVEERRIGFVFQTARLFPHLDVAGNIAYGAKRREVTSYGAIIEALDLGPLLQRPVDGLSGGETRRVALGRALASNPQVLFLDEPLAGLDSGRKTETLAYVARAVAEAQVPAIYVSHAADEVGTVADRVLGLAGGRITGWQLPPMRLTGHVVAVEREVMRVRIDGAPDGRFDLTLPARAHAGERIGIGLPAESVLVSARSPGAGTAELVLPADKIAPLAQGARVGVFGQVLDLPRAPAVPDGARLWISVLRVLTRPEAADSADAGANRRSIDQKVGD